MAYHIVEQLRDWRSNHQPILWIQPTYEASRSYNTYRKKAGHYKLEDFDIMVIKWIHIRCDNGFERKVIHSIAESAGWSHKTIRRTYTTTSDYHQKYQRWTYETTCDGCTVCQVFRSEKVGVLVACEKLRIRQDLSGRITELRKQLS
jgi:hypothetical protein